MKVPDVGKERDVATRDRRRTHRQAAVQTEPDIAGWMSADRIRLPVLLRNSGEDTARRGRIGACGVARLGGHDAIPALTDKGRMTAASPPHLHQADWTARRYNASGMALHA